MSPLVHVCGSLIGVAVNEDFCRKNAGNRVFFIERNIHRRKSELARDSLPLLDDALIAHGGIVPFVAEKESEG
jgi:hypothetical protein